MSSATKNERNSSHNENKVRQSTSRTKCLENYNSPPQTKIPKTVSKKSFHLNGRSLKHDLSNADISQNIPPSILNTSQMLNTPLNRSLNFSKNPIFAPSPIRLTANGTNLKEHIRTKTQSSAIENESQTDRNHLFENKRKTLLKNNSSSNILEKSGLRKKMSSSSYKKRKESNNVNVKKINLITKNEEYIVEKSSSKRDSTLTSPNELSSPPIFSHQFSNNSEGINNYFKDETGFHLEKEKKKTSNLLKSREKRRFHLKKTLKRERKNITKQLKEQREKQKNLIFANHKIEENREMLARNIRNITKENLSIKLALDFVQMSHNKVSINYDFLIKTPSIIVPTTDFRVFYDKVLGTGGFGTVYEGLFNSKKVAIKVMSIPFDYLKMLLKEIISMMICDHPNLVKLHAVSFGHKENNQLVVFIIMECLKQDLKNLIFKERARLPLRLKYKILSDILKGLAHLHESHYVHCDIKLQNILVDENFNAKISDFGLANCLRSGNTKNTVIAGYSERTSAYEYLCEQKISTKGDIWSFGVLMYEILNEKVSWEPLSGVQVVAKVSMKTPFFDYNARGPNKFEEGIIESCLNYNYMKRPTAKELLNIFDACLIKLKS